MPISQAQFDADLAAERTATSNLITAQGTYIAAVTVLIQNPAVVDLSAEDASVNSQLQDVTNAGQALATAQGQLPPPNPNPSTPAA